ncbi:MAG: type II secretion system protein [Dechloromonas sp.]|nr:type II secretion system protein [Dechloromonas sp.]
MPPKHHRIQQGFSLIELTVVLVIVALLSGGLMLGLAAQREANSYQEAQRQLDSAKEALLGFAISNGRLPCPATANLANTDANAGRENCASAHGVLPWATLGLPESDPWGRRLTYYAQAAFTATVAAGALASFTLDTQGNANVKDAAASGYDIASGLPAVIVSHGSRGFGGYQSSGAQLLGAAGEEAENSNANLTFIAHTPTDSFDDLVTWIIPTVLKSRMVAVGKLP